jgi:hypothetical protein
MPTETLQNSCRVLATSLPFICGACTRAHTDVHNSTLLSVPQLIQLASIEALPRTTAVRRVGVHVFGLSRLRRRPPTQQNIF